MWRMAEKPFSGITKPRTPSYEIWIVIGQAVKDLGTDRLRDEQPAIPWSQIAGARNVLAHQYLGVDLTLVWNIVEKDLPTLKAAIREAAKRMSIQIQEQDDQS